MEINQLLPLFDSFKDPILLVDQDGRITGFNQSALVIADGKPRRLSGKHILETLHLQNDSGAAWEMAIHKIKGETTIRFLNEELVVELSTLVVGDKTLVMMKDFSLEKKLHESFKSQIAELEHLNQNLEKEVAIRTEELTFQNHLLSRIYVAIDETVILCDVTGRCLPHQPEKSAEFFGLKTLSGLSAAELIFQDSGKQDQFSLWLSIFQAESLPDQDLEALMDQDLKLGDRFIEMRLKILNSATKIILFILKDQTEARQMKLRLKELGESNRFLEALLKEPARLSEKFQEWEEMCREIESTVAQGDHERALNKLHLLKGSLQLESFYEAYQEVHRIELLHENVNAIKIDQLKSILREKRQFTHGSSKISPNADSLKRLISHTVRILEKECENFQYNISGDAYVSNFYKQSLELIIVQHFRNLLAHAFSSPEERQHEGKSRDNILSIKIEETLGSLSIRVSDDGKGLRSAARKKEAGFMSGMGRGIEAMKLEAKKINGSIELKIHENGSDLTIELKSHLAM